MNMTTTKTKTATQAWLQQQSARDEHEDWQAQVYARRALNNQNGRLPITPQELVSAMLRDYRFKRIMLANAEHLFVAIPPAVKLELFREAIREMLKGYKIKDVKEVYKMLGSNLRTAGEGKP